MLYVGIDPGSSGAVACLNEDGTIHKIFKLPKELKVQSDYDQMDDIFSYLEDVEGACVIQLEKVGAGGSANSAGRRCGARSMFSFGQGFGALRASLSAHGLGYELVLPRKWLLSFDLKKDKMESYTDWKNRHKYLAQELYPEEKMTHQKSDALLLAVYSRNEHLGLNK